MRRRPRPQTPMDEIARDIQAQKKACPICGVPLARWVAFALLAGALLYAVFYTTTWNGWRDEAKEVSKQTAEHLCKLLMANWSMARDVDGIKRAAAFLLKLAPGQLERHDTERINEIRHIHDSYDTLRRGIVDTRDTNSALLYSFLVTEMETHLGPKSVCDASAHVEDRLSDPLGYYSDVTCTATTRNNASKRNVAYRLSGKLRQTADRGALLFEARLMWKK